jgi:hypothetical protein
VASGPSSWAAAVGLRPGKFPLFFFCSVSLFYFSLFSVLCFLFELILVFADFELGTCLQEFEFGKSCQI